MTAAELSAWQAHMGFSYTTAAKALGVNRATYARLLAGESGIDRRTALACAAITAGLEPWGGEGTEPHSTSMPTSAAAPAKVLPSS